MENNAIQNTLAWTTAINFVGAIEALKDAVANDAPLLLDAHVVRTQVEPLKKEC